MPFLTNSSFRPPWYLPGGHLQTIVPSLLRRVPQVTLRKERLELADGDFLDLKWSCEKGRGRGRLAILCHGLEANADASYVQEMAGALCSQGWDVLAWSYRGCSGEMNRLPRFYHSGATEDLVAVVEHAMKVHLAAQVDLVGFSLGGNLILKYLGEQSNEVSSRLGGAVTFSVPCDLASSSKVLDSLFNREVYMRRFMKSLAGKIRQKKPFFPEMFDTRGLEDMRTFREFDDRFTAPLHGFDDAADYWRSSSSRPFLSEITIPALLVNADNDPFLGLECYPKEEAAASEHFYLEVPQEGGHVGFPSNQREGSWMAERAIRFLQEV